jgi:alpha-glucuronidase
VTALQFGHCQEYQIKQNTMRPQFFVLLFIALAMTPRLKAEDGYRLWLRYDKITDEKLARNYREAVQSLVIQPESPTLAIADKELRLALNGLLGIVPTASKNVVKAGSLIVGTPEHSAVVRGLALTRKLEMLGSEGYLINTVTVDGKKCIVIAANTDIGVMYGVFAFLRLLQTNNQISNLAIAHAPRQGGLRCGRLDYTRHIHQKLLNS